MTPRDALLRLWAVLGATERRALIRLTIISLLSSLTEAALLAAVIPFAAALSGTPRGIIGLAPLSVGQAGALFFVAILIASLLRLVTLRTQAGAVRLIAEYVSNRGYWRTLNRPYADHMLTNTSQLTVTLIGRVDLVVNAVIFPCVSGISQILLSITILTMLFLIHPQVTLILSVTIFGAYAAFIVMARSVLARESVRHSEGMTALTRVTSESLLGIRDVLLSGLQHYWMRAYRDAQHRFRAASEQIIVTSATPRIMIECVGFAIVIAIACLLMRGDQARSALPVLAIMILGAQRLLPVAQGAYLSWTSLRGNLPHLTEMLPLLEQRDTSRSVPTHPLPLVDRLILADVNYRYPSSTAPVLDALDLDIAAGTTIGIVGPSGGGKSTLLDIVMGLLPADTGYVMVDGTALSPELVPAWQASIAHVPQNVHLADATIAENIALGIARIDVDDMRLARAMRLADIADLVATLPHGVDTPVGERGVLLSGGQIQRIGIARALYRDAGLLVLDEATSSLDPATEARVLKAIRAAAIGVTILMVTHRHASLYHCDAIYQLEAGRLSGPIPHAALLASP